MKISLNQGRLGLGARNELARQLVHLMLGLLIIAGLLLLWKLTHGWQFIAVFVTWVVFILFCALIYLIARGAKTPFNSWFEFMGKRDDFIGEGALWYLLGLMITLSFLDRFLYIISTIYILSVGDSISTIFTYKKKYEYSFFKGRNWASYLAFIAFTLPISILMGVKAIPLIILCAVIESLDLKINDNFLIPLVCVIYLLVV